MSEAADGRPLLPSNIHGRGAGYNPEQRFAALHLEYDDGHAPGKVATKLFRDHSSSIISKHSSPDLPFEASLNPYRGCEHGCAYCYARPTHEYLGFSAGVDFETRLMVKEDAPTLLRAELCKPSYKPVTLSLSGVTDPYQPIEKKLRITRGCLEVLAEARHPVWLITKNHLITRDVDLLVELARHQAVGVYISLTSLNAELAHKLEPRASAPKMRLEAIRTLRQAGVPVGVSTAPIIPGLNDSEIPALIEAAKEAGALYAGYTVVRLPFAVKDVFRNWLDQHFPGMRDKILSRIEETQGRTLSHGEFGKRLKGVGLWAQQIEQIYRVSIKRADMLHKRPEVNASAFRRPRDVSGQMELF